MSVPSRSIDLNADLGEGFPHDLALLDRVTSASVACGGHAGDRSTMLRTLSAAKERGVIVGAHPGFADRESFGRREREVTASEVEELVRAQAAALVEVAGEAGLVPRYLKPHGALYNQAQRDPDVARGVLLAMITLGWPVVGQPGGVLEGLAKEAGHRFVPEGFPERRYRDDGRLVPRTEPDAVLADRSEIEAQVLRLVEQGVETLCIHGDDPRAVEKAEIVRSALGRHGIGLRSFA